MPLMLTKLGRDVFAPTTAGGTPRGADMGDASVLTTEYEVLLEALIADAGGLTLPSYLVYALNTGAGTANAVTATATQTVLSTPYAQLITVNFVAANTGPMTLQLNGGAALPLVTNTGDVITSGYVKAGMAALVQRDSTGNYRLFSYGDAAAIQAAVEAAKAAAEDAATRAETAAAGVEYPVSYAPQVLNDTQKDQARQNLGIERPIYGDAIVILATGQSNIANDPAFAWTPPENLFLWNGFASTGTQFDPMTNSIMRVSYSFAAEVARNNPTRQVYVINIGQGSQLIAQWMVGAASPDMYARCKANVEAALAVLGVSKIDHFLWWQGESDYLAASSTYVADFQTVWLRFITESWFERWTRVTIMGVSEIYASIPPMRIFNNTLRRIVGMEPQYRTFVDTSVLSASYWSPEGAVYLHMNANGYRVAGEMAYRAAFEGAGAGFQRGKWQTIYKPVNETRTSNTTLADDIDLSVYLTDGTWRLRGSIIGISSFTPDFKFAFKGPAASDVVATVRVVKQDAPTAETISMTRGADNYPAGTILLGATTYFRIEFDLLVSATAGGILAFQWAQVTSDPGTCRVNYGSYFDYMQVFGI